MTSYVLALKVVTMGLLLSLTSTLQAQKTAKHDVWDSINWKLDYLNAQLDTTSDLLQCTHEIVSTGRHGLGCKHSCVTISKQAAMVKNKPTWITLSKAASFVPEMPEYCDREKP